MASGNLLRRFDLLIIFNAAILSRVRSSHGLFRHPPYLIFMFSYLCLSWNSDWFRWFLMCILTCIAECLSVRVHFLIFSPSFLCLLTPFMSSLHPTSPLSDLILFNCLQEDESKVVKFKLEDTHDEFGPMAKDLKVSTQCTYAHTSTHSTIQALKRTCWWSCLKEIYFLSILSFFSLISLFFLFSYFPFLSLLHRVGHLQLVRWQENE